MARDGLDDALPLQRTQREGRLEELDRASPQLRADRGDMLPSDVPYDTVKNSVAWL